MTGVQIAERVRELSRQGALADALALCLSGQDGFPANETLWQLRLNLLRRLGRLEEARTIATDTSVDSKRARATPLFQRLAFEIFLDLDDLDGARERLEMFAAADPRKGAAYLMCRARLGLADPQDTEALAEITPHLPEFAEHAGLIRSVADLMVARGRHSDAIAVLAHGWQATGQAALLAQQARLMAEQGNAAEAAALLEEQAAVLPDAPWLWRLRLQLVGEAEGVTRAADLAAKAVAANPTSAGLRRQAWACAIAAGRTEAVLAEAGTLAAYADSPVELRVLAVQTSLEFGPAEPALSLARALADAAPGNAEAAQLAVQAELEQGFDALAAVARADAAIAAGARSVALTEARAVALVRSGFSEQAMTVLMELHETGQLRDFGAVRLAAILVQRGQFDAAARVLDRRDQQTDAAKAARERWLGESALRQGDLSAARHHLLRAVAIRGEDGDHLQVLICAQILAGDYAAAWGNHARNMALRAKRRPADQRTTRLRRTLLGNLLNEIRLKYGDRDRVGLRWDTAKLGSAGAVFREDLLLDPGNTAAATGLLSVLHRTGAMDGGALDGQASQAGASDEIPRVIGQFWDMQDPPAQVADLMQWNHDMNPGYRYCRFDQASAWNYMQEREETDALWACVLSSHVAARSDVFRLVWLWHEGGVWLDADDRCTAPLGTLIDHGRRFVGYQEIYGTVGNNFMAVRRQDPIIRAALDDAVGSILETAGAPIWLSSGPGAITRALALQGTQADGTLAAGIRLMPAHQLLRAVSPHVRLNYKGTASHWVRQMQAPSR